VKKLIFAGFIAFWASVGTVALLEVLTPPPGTSEETSPTTTFSIGEVAAHDTLDDCWMAIEGQVYDFTDYIADHPTPPSVLAPWCGTEATEGMRTKGIGRVHSPAAWVMLDAYRVGRLTDD
jgi:cytochrome b involved in lipid metabolism